jgi:hypothetical protein
MTSPIDPAGDFLATLNAMSRELDGFALSVAQRVVTDAERERMAALFEDFAGVIRVTLGTRQIGDAMEAGDE